MVSTTPRQIWSGPSTWPPSLQVTSPCSSQTRLAWRGLFTKLDYRPPCLGRDRPPRVPSTKATEEGRQCHHLLGPRASSLTPSWAIVPDQSSSRTLSVNQEPEPLGVLTGVLTERGIEMAYESAAKRRKTTRGDVASLGQIKVPDQHFGRATHHPWKPLRAKPLITRRSRVQIPPPPPFALVS